MSEHSAVASAGTPRATGSIPKGTQRVVVAGVLGTVIEYFDFLVYATVSSLVFGQLFFPTSNEFVATLLVWSTFAVGYLARPIGGLVFGHYGDKVGRKQMLFITLMMMGSATLVIGLLPTYETIGIAAPVILILMRVVQGIGVGGEYGGATTLVIEHAHDTGRRGLLGAFMSASSMFGFILATGLMAILTRATTDAQFLGGAWRIPFLLSAALVLVGFYIRYSLDDTPAMKKIQTDDEVVRVPLLEIFTRHTKTAFIALGAPFGVFAAYYIIVVFSISYTVSETGADASFVLTMSTVSQVLYFFFILFGGWISDRVGRRLPLIIGAVGLAAWSFALFPLLLTGTTGGILLGLSVGLFFLGLLNGPQAAFLAELFGTRMRYSGLSLGWQVSAAIAGGLSPVVATVLLEKTNSWVSMPVMLTVALGVTLAAVLASGNRTNVSLID